ncbi:MAG: flagellar biosynthetic protein FliO [Nitrospirota bacterium]
MMYAYFQMALALAAVIGFIALIGFALRKQRMTGHAMRIVAFQSLGQRKGLFAVKVGTDVHLLSVTPADVRLIKTYASDAFKTEPSPEISDALQKLKSLKERLL